MAKAKKASVAVTEQERQFPVAMYKSMPVSDKHPNGYVVKRINDEKEYAALGKEWKGSPADL